MQDARARVRARAGGVKLEKNGRLVRLTQVKSFVLFLALFNDLGRFRVAFCINKTYLRCKNVW